MTEGRDPRDPGPEPEPEPDAPAPVDLDTLDARSQTPASRLAAYVRGGGVIVPLLTVLLAFVIGGLVVLLVGKDPIATYEAIFRGSGLQWFFPWVTGDDRTIAALNLQQTLIITTPLILLGLAVAFAFRAGLFNIGGQGQYTMGLIAAVWVGSEFTSLPSVLHVLLATAAAVAAGAFWAGIVGFLKATTGANEVISSIMLNYTAIYIGLYLFGLGGPLQNDREASLPVSNDVDDGAKLPVFWGDPDLQGLHVGLFIALAALVVFWLLLNRSTRGYEVRAVGLNPEAARYGGMSVSRNYVLVMAVCGAFAGLAGSLDILGLAVPPGHERHRVQHAGLLRHRRGAARAQHGGRHGGGGVAVRRADQRHLAAQPRPHDLRALAGLQPDADHPGPGGAGGERRRAGARSAAAREGAAARPSVPVESAPPAGPAVASASLRRRRMSALAEAAAPSRIGVREIGWLGIALGVLAWFIALPPILLRSAIPSLLLALVAVGVGVYVAREGEKRLGYGAVAAGVIGGIGAVVATRSGVENLEAVFVWSALFAAMLRFATPLILAALGGIVCERSGVINIGLEGMMLMGAFFGIFGADLTGSWMLGALLGMAAGGALAVIHAVLCVGLRADQVVSGTGVNLLALGVTGYVFIAHYGDQGTPGSVPRVPTLTLPLIEDIPFFGEAIGSASVLTWVALILVPAARAGPVPHAREGCACAPWARSRARPRPWACRCSAPATSP